MTTLRSFSTREFESDLIPELERQLADCYRVIDGDAR